MKDAIPTIFVYIVAIVSALVIVLACGSVYHKVKRENQKPAAPTACFQHSGAASNPDCKQEPRT